MNLISICDFFSSHRQLREDTNDSDRHRVWSCGQMRAWVAWGLIGEAGAGVYQWASDSVQGNPASCVGWQRCGSVSTVAEAWLRTPESACSRWDPHEEITSHPQRKTIIFLLPAMPYQNLKLKTCWGYNPRVSQGTD